MRDSRLVHAFLGLTDHEALAGRTVFAPSFEGFAIENLLATAPRYAAASFYRTSAGAEIDLVLEISGGERWAIEVRAGLNTEPPKGFGLACEDTGAARRFVVYPGDERYRLPHGVGAIGLRELAGVLARL